MLKFEDCFDVNVVNRLKEMINSIPVEGCVDSFTNYLEEGANNNSSFEGKFKRKLFNDYEQVILRTYMKEHQNKSKEELLKSIEDLIYDSSTCIRSDAENYSVKEVFDYWPVTDADAHEIIKDYMLETLDKLVEEINKTAKDKEIEEIKTCFVNSKAALDATIKQLEAYEKKLIELGVNVDEL